MLSKWNANRGRDVMYMQMKVSDFLFTPRSHTEGGKK